MIIPKKVFFTTGCGTSGDSTLESFENALYNAGIGHLNLVPVSSIIPPYCEFIIKEEGLDKLAYCDGAITFCVLSRCQNDLYLENISAAVGFARSSNKHRLGYLSEYHHSDDFKLIEHSQKKAKIIVEGMACRMYHNRFKERPEHIGSVVRSEPFPTDELYHVSVISAAVFIL